MKALLLLLEKNFKKIYHAFAEIKHRIKQTGC